MMRPWRSACCWMVLIVGVLYGGLIRVHSFSYHKNLSGFICLGDRYMPATRVPPGMLVLPDSVGYDGTFFYMMAHDPFIRGVPRLEQAGLARTHHYRGALGGAHVRGVRRVRLRATGAVQDGIVGRNRTLLIDF